MNHDPTYKMEILPLSYILLGNIEGLIEIDMDPLKKSDHLCD
jgi:hypothetical protein